MISYSEVFKTRILNLYGRSGQNWLENLPALRQSLRERWALFDTQPRDNLSYNYLEFAVSPEYGPVVLKIGVPNLETESEINSLVISNGQGGAVKLLDHDLNQGALLVERVMPGNDLTTLTSDDQAARIAAEAMLSLHLPVPEKTSFPSMADWCRGFERYQESHPNHDGPLPEELITNGSSLAADLLASAQDQFLLHGDLHHGNLLYRQDNTWAVIDPKGVVGEFAFEVGPFVYNPIPDLIQRSDLMNLLRRRIRILEEITGVGRDRLAGWSFCRAVLAGIWSAEDGDPDLDYWVSISAILSRLVNE